MKRRHARIVVMLLALVGGLFGSAQASAAPAQPVGTAGYVVNTATVPANGQVNCFGYVGIFKPGTHVVVINWDSTPLNECFGVTTDRTIWHTWQGAGAWTRMPGNGHADDVVSMAPENPDGGRLVVVYVAGSPTHWCQEYVPGSGWTGIWGTC